jgi:hypothetical protein
MNILQVDVHFRQGARLPSGSLTIRVFPSASGLADGALGSASRAARSLIAAASIASSAAFTITAAATAAAATTVAAATSTSTILAWFGFVHGERSAIVLLFIQSADRGLCLGFGGHLHKTKAFAATGITIGDHLRTLD